MSGFTESVVEQAALAWFEALGYTITGGPTIAPNEPGEERRSYADVVLDGRLREALARLNPAVSREGLDLGQVEPMDPARITTWVQLNPFESSHGGDAFAQSPRDLSVR